MFNAPFRLPSDGSWNPPVVRVSGVDLGTQEGKAALDAVTGHLKQFYLASAQNRDLSDLGVFRRSISSDDYKFTYRKVMGQEILEVALRTGGETTTTTKTSDFWDWAIVEFSVPLTENIYAIDGPGAPPRYVGAIGGLYMRCTEVQMDYDPIWGFEKGGAGKSIAQYFSSEGLTIGSSDYPDGSATSPMVAIYDPRDLSVPLSTGTGYVSKVSFRIDMRNFHSLTQLTFEVYGNLLNAPDDYGPDPTKKIQNAVLVSADYLAGVGFDVTAYNNDHVLLFDPSIDTTDLLTNYPDVAALSPHLVSLSSPATGLFGNNDATLAAYAFDPDPLAVKNPQVGVSSYGSYDNFTDYGVYGLGSLTIRTASSAYDPALGGWIGDTPDVFQTGFVPDLAPDSSIDFPWDPSLGVGIFKWQSTAWGEVHPTLGETSFTITPGVWAGSTPAIVTQFISYSQKVWFINTPYVGPLPVDVTKAMTVVGNTYRRDPKFKEYDFDTPNHAGHFAYAVWGLASGGDPHFHTLGSVVVDNAEVDFDGDAPRPFYVPKVHHDGRPFLGTVTISPQTGAIAFHPAR